MSTTVETVIQPQMAEGQAVVSLEEVVAEEGVGEDASEGDEEYMAADTSGRKKMQCQAVGCTADLTANGKYCMKRRLCRTHLKADSVLRKKGGTELWRFCQQCGKLEPLTFFDGCKRSCRVQLERRRQSQSTSNAAKKGRASSFTADSSPYLQPTSTSAAAASAAAAEASAPKAQVSLWLQQLAELREKQQLLEHQVMSQLVKQQQDVYGTGIDAAFAAEAAAPAGYQDSQSNQHPSLAATAGSGCQGSWLAETPSLAATAGSGAWRTQPSGVEAVSPVQSSAGFQAPWDAVRKISTGMTVGTGGDMASALQTLLHPGQGVSQMHHAPPAAAAILPAASTCMAGDGFILAPPMVLAAESAAQHNLQMAALMQAWMAARQLQTGQHTTAALFQQLQQQQVAAGLMGDACASSQPISAGTDSGLGCIGVTWSQLQGAVIPAQAGMQAADMLHASHGTGMMGRTSSALQPAAISAVTANQAASPRLAVQQYSCSPVGDTVAAASTQPMRYGGAGDVQHMGAALSAITVKGAPNRTGSASTGTKKKKESAAAMPTGAEGDAAMSIEYDSFMSLLMQVPAEASAKGLDSLELAAIIQTALDEVKAQTQQESMQQQQESGQRPQQQLSEGMTNRTNSSSSASPFANAAMQETAAESQANAADATTAAGNATVPVTTPVESNKMSAPLAAPATTVPSARLLSLLAPAATRQHTLDMYGALLASMPGGQALESFMSMMHGPSSLDSMAQLESALMEAVAEPQEGTHQQQQAAGNAEALQPVIVPVWKSGNCFRQNPPKAAAPTKPSSPAPAAVGLNSCSMLDADALHESMLPPSLRCEGGGGGAAGYGAAAEPAAGGAAASAAAQTAAKPKCISVSCEDWKLEWE